MRVRNGIRAAVAGDPEAPSIAQFRAHCPQEASECQGRSGGLERRTASSSRRVSLDASHILSQRRATRLLNPAGEESIQDGNAADLRRYAIDTAFSWESQSAVRARRPQHGN